MDLVVPEVAAGVAELQEHGVCDSLPRERGARSPEGNGHLVLSSNGQDLLNLLLCVHLQDNVDYAGTNFGSPAVFSVSTGAAEVLFTLQVRGAFQETTMLHASCVLAMLTGTVSNASCVLAMLTGTVSKALSMVLQGRCLSPTMHKEIVGHG